MESIKFSIIVPVYNAEQYLQSCIESILNQTYKNFELILVDDGSKDLSRDICDRYQKDDDRIKVYYQVNQGAKKARERAIKEATGDFYLFLDADDYYDENALKSINKVILSEKCDLVIYRYRRVSDNGDILFESESLFKDMEVFTEENKRLLFEEVISGPKLNNLWNKVVSSALIDENFYNNKQVTNGEDLLQSLPLMYKSKKTIYMDKVLYNYRVNPSSITSNFNVNFFDDITTVRKEVIEYMKLLKIYEKEYIIKLYNSYVHSTLRYIYQLVDSNMNKYSKFKIFDRVRNEELFREAYNDYRQLESSKVNEMTLYLLNNNSFYLLHIYCKLRNFIIKLRKKVYFLLKGKRYA